jgi:hypothetical protein
MERNEKIVLASIAVGALILSVHYAKSLALSRSTSDPLAPIGDETDFGFSGTIEFGHGTTISHEEKQKQALQKASMSRMKRKLTVNNIF